MQRSWRQDTTLLCKGSQRIEPIGVRVHLHVDLGVKDDPTGVHETRPSPIRHETPRFIGLGIRTRLAANETCTSG